MDTGEEGGAALAGVRVIELAEGVAGPYCGKLLAGLGADVLKVEPPHGDCTRRAGPFPGDVFDPERSGLFLHLNTGKRSAVLPWARIGERPEFLSRVSEADVLLTSLRPKELERASIDLDDLRARLPRLVIVSVTPFGLRGPYADYEGPELVVYALSGYMSLTGAPERKPLKAYGELIGFQAGVHAALGALAALRVAERTGCGQIVDVAAMEAGTFLIGGVEQRAHFFGEVARRNGTRLVGFAREHTYPSTIRPCADGYVHCHSNNRYPDLLGVLIPHPRLRDPELLQAMMAHADEIDAILDGWLAGKTRREAVRLAQELRLPFTEVLTPREVLADEHVRARGCFVRVTHPGAGEVVQPGAPMRLSRTPWRNLPAPRLGEATDSFRAGTVWTSVRSQSSGLRGAGEHRTRNRPLDGVRVLDFTVAVAGPLCTALLADLGAEVIKVEAPNGRPLHAAGTAPLQEPCPDEPWNRVMLFNQLNRGKRSVVLDVSRPEGRQLFLELTASVDVLVQNFAPRVLPNLGLAEPVLREVNPPLILVSMPAFGLDGPYRDRGSYGPGIDAMSGLSHLTGYPDGPPMKPGNFFCDQNAALHAAVAVLAALRHRDRTGEGQHAEMPMLDGELQLLADAYLDVLWNGRDRFRAANDHPVWFPHDVYRCHGEDAWVAIAVRVDDEWRRLAELIGRPDLARDERLETASGRRQHRREVDAAIEAWTRTRDPREAQETLQSAGIAAGAVLDAGALLRDPHLGARGYFRGLHVPCVGPTPHPRAAFLLSESRAAAERPAPAFGEANEYVLCELLGHSREELEEWEREGIVAWRPIARGG